MKKKLSTLPFKGTAEQAEALKAVIEEYKSVDGALVTVMNKAQEIYGYLPIEIQKEIADGLGVTLEEVYGVASFYALFSMTPKGKHTISICLGTACYVKGSGDILAEFEKLLGIKSGECTEDGKFSLEACRCIGACGLAPVLTVDGDVYGRLTAKDVAGILEKYQD